MSALGTIWLSLKYMSAAHNLTVRGSLNAAIYSLRQPTKRRMITWLDALGRPATLASDKNARVHLYARRVYSQTKAEKFEVATSLPKHRHRQVSVSLKELGYGG
ncbi:MAG TPA: hypothetical protein PK224_10310 [Nitrospira sp.]|nr:hypothetical protein [Nitrospira sp.]